MRLLIVGTGTIGKPLISLFLKERHNLGIEEVIFHKNQPELKCRGMLARFMARGGCLAVYPEREADFKELLGPIGLAPRYLFEEALAKADIIIDCTDKKIPFELKEKYYQHLSGKLGIIAQGSAKNFGHPYAFDINDSTLTLEKQPFVQIVSCNTHQILCLLKTLVFDPDQRGQTFWNMDNLIEARFEMNRRSADVSQDKMVIGAKADKPTDPFFGSHQAEDAARVIATLYPQLGLDLHSTTLELNNPFMHVVVARLKLKESVTVQELERRLRFNHLIAVTYEPLNNRVFSNGRDEALEFSGRIFNQTVVFLPGLEVIRDSHEAVIKCFTPQDGNALLSSVAAVMQLKYPDTYQKIIKDNFYKEPPLFKEI